MAGDIRSIKYEKNKDDIRYILPCCKTCNSKKGAMDILRFLSINEIEFNTLGSDIILTILRAQARAYGDEEATGDWVDLYESFK
uniref:HNH endonuclease n=1 Tax=Nitrosopumivirus cobalaminus TaxID=3158414 RepID=A0AAU7N4B2_9VIRU